MKIVVGFIDSPEGNAAIERATEEARLRNASLVIVHSKIGGRHDKAEDYLAMAKTLDDLTDRLTEAGVDHDVHEYVRGDKPAADLMQAVADYDAELIVIGIRKRTATGKAFLGSNALDVLHDATVPVLCVKAPQSTDPTTSESAAVSSTSRWLLTVERERLRGAGGEKAR